MCYFFVYRSASWFISLHQDLQINVPYECNFETNGTPCYLIVVRCRATEKIRSISYPSCGSSYNIKHEESQCAVSITTMLMIKNQLVEILSSYNSLHFSEQTLNNGMLHAKQSKHILKEYLLQSLSKLLCGGVDNKVFTPCIIGWILDCMWLWDEMKTETHGLLDHRHGINKGQFSTFTDTVQGKVSFTHFLHFR